jgi:hypothetical protein
VPRQRQVEAAEHSGIWEAPADPRAPPVPGLFRAHASAATPVPGAGSLGVPCVLRQRHGGANLRVRQPAEIGRDKRSEIGRMRSRGAIGAADPHVDRR